MTHVNRWKAALCQNEVGTYQAINEFTTELSAADKVQFAGDYVFGAVGQSIAVESGNRAAGNIIGELK